MPEQRVARCMPARVSWAILGPGEPRRGMAMSGERSDLEDFEERLAMLRGAYKTYMTAELGELNITAEQLRDAAYMCGWGGGSSPLPWVREMLGIET